MKIAIDATRAVTERAGIGRITYQLIENLLKTDHKNQYLLFFSYFRKSLEKEKLIQKFKKPNVEIKTYRIPGALKEKIWAWKIPWFNRTLGKSEVLLAPSFLEVNLGVKIPQVVIIYDMTTFLFPDQRGQAVSERLSKRTKIACKKAEKIIAISEATKRDVLNILKIPSSKVVVTYPGLTRLPEPAKKLPQGLKEKSYILFVGTIEPRKNLIGLFRAYAMLSAQLQEKFPLVVVGAQGWNTGETYQVLRKENLKDKVIFLGYQDDNMLAKLYREAAVFVYPSLYEGFGIPIIEAMSFGTPVITSNVSSMPEAAGKAALLIDPTEPKSISSALQRVLEGEFKVSNTQLKAQANKFSWEKAAKEVLRALEEAANG